MYNNKYFIIFIKITLSNYLSINLLSTVKERWNKLILIIVIIIKSSLGILEKRGKVSKALIINYQKYYIYLFTIKSIN
jgi:hypothetical protein